MRNGKLTILSASEKDLDDILCLGDEADNEDEAYGEDEEGEGTEQLACEFSYSFALITDE